VPFEIFLFNDHFYQACIFKFRTYIATQMAADTHSVYLKVFKM